MCGLVGVVDLDGQPPRGGVPIEAMTAALHHRGPDGRGVERLGPVALGHTRLRIIDLSERGRQPLSNEDGSVWVVYNGEIYDHDALRRELEGRGHRFASRTDTEVLVHLYEEEGLDGLARLNGMFAFALWDARRQTLVLGRDRTGQKPLYVYRKGPTLAFASELKALAAHPGLDLERDPEAIPAYLAHGYVPGERTFHRFVTELEPGAFQTWHIGRPSPSFTRYWRYPETDRSPPSFEAATAEVRKLVGEAVERRLVADVPLGAFLSGGVDSSVVVAVMAKTAGARVRTFSLGFDGDPRFDESAYARRVAEALGTDHTELRVGPDSFERVPEIMAHWDEPFGDSSALPTWLVSQLAREHTTVALTGDGGDELFAGYARFSSVAYTERVPGPIRGLLGQGAAAVPLPRRREGRRARGLRFLGRLRHALPERLHSWIAVFPPDELEALTGRPLTPPVYPDSVLDSGRDDVLNACLRLNARTYLVGDLNPKVDRASMAHALETRSPFLDARLMAYVFGLPGRYKIDRGRRKWILRAAFRDALPAWVFERRKMGFGLPLGTWFAGPLRPWVRDQIGHRKAAIADHVRIERVLALVDENERGERDHGHRLWALLMLEAWLRSGPGTSGRSARC